jgi:hypothetical protein
MQEILNSLPTGRFNVTTASGASYLLDMDARTSVRTANSSRAHRRDGKPLHLDFVVECILGQPLMLSVGKPDRGYTRAPITIGTRVRSIVPINV